MKLTGKYVMQLIRGDTVIAEARGKNSIVTEGKNELLDVVFGSTAKNSHYIGLINNSPTPSLSETDTAASHAGWDETSDYTEANRPTFTVGSASGASVTSSATSDFTINATVNIFGFFVITDNTKGGTSGVLWATAAFASGIVAAISSDVVKITYTVELG